MAAVVCVHDAADDTWFLRCMLSTSNVQAAEYRSSSWSWFLFLWRRQCLRCLAFDYVFVFEFCTIVALTIARGFAPFF
jgi:hypothetical protein